jgi:hypothetical protein
MSRTIIDPIAEALNLSPIEFDFDTLEELKNSQLDYGTSGFEGYTHTHTHSPTHPHASSPPHTYTRLLAR